MFPAVNARILKRRNSNIGWVTWRSTHPNTKSITRPPRMSDRTMGLVHPMLWPP